MAITRTLILNAVLLCLPPMIILGVFKFFFVRHIRWAAGVVALIDVVIFQTQLFYYESMLACAVLLVIHWQLPACFPFGFTKNTIKNEMS